MPVFAHLSSLIEIQLNIPLPVIPFFITLAISVCLGTRLLQTSAAAQPFIYNALNSYAQSDKLILNKKIDVSKVLLKSISRMPMESLEGQKKLMDMTDYIILSLKGIIDMY